MLAARAFDEAKRSLRGDDPDLMRAVTVHFGLRCDEAMRRDDVKQAMAIAGSAANFALGCGDRKAALRWYQYASDLAARSLKPEDRDRKFKRRDHPRVTETPPQQSSAACANAAVPVPAP